MYYLIQKNVFQDPGYDQIFEVMQELNLSYETVQFLPNSNLFNFQTSRKDVFVYGSVKLAKVATHFDWQPGSFYGGNHEYEKYAQGFGENLINFGSLTCPLTHPFNWAEGQKWFIKPAREAKVFTGKVFNQHEWTDFLYEQLNDPNNKRLTESTLIQVSKPHQLIKEARIWIVGGKVITSSYYKFHGDQPFEEKVETSGLEFAQEMANLYKVADAFVLDIALTHEGWKVMEVNCINSTGFYRGEVRKIVVALEEFFG